MIQKTWNFLLCYNDINVSPQRGQTLFEFAYTFSSFDSTYFFSFRSRSEWPNEFKQTDSSQPNFLPWGPTHPWPTWSNWPNFGPWAPTNLTQNSGSFRFILKNFRLNAILGNKDTSPTKQFNQITLMPLINGHTRLLFSIKKILSTRCYLSH